MIKIINSKSELQEEMNGRKVMLIVGSKSCQPCKQLHARVDGMIGEGKISVPVYYADAGTDVMGLLHARSLPISAVLNENIVKNTKNGFLSEANIIALIGG